MLSACLVNSSLNRPGQPEQGFRILFQTRLLWERDAHINHRYTKVHDQLSILYEELPFCYAPTVVLQ